MTTSSLQVLLGNWILDKDGSFSGFYIELYSNTIRTTEIFYFTIIVAFIIVYKKYSSSIYRKPIIFRAIGVITKYFINMKKIDFL